MELIPRIREWIASEHVTPAHKPARYLFVVVATLLCLVVLSTSATVLARSTRPPPNVFAPFTDVFPGEPRSGVEVRGFLCSSDPYQRLPTEYCTLNPPTGVFSQVGVIVNQNVINEISFRLRDDTLRVGDLMVLWGIPVVSEYTHSVYFFWRDQHNFALVTEYTGQFSLYLPVRRVSIGNNAALLTEYAHP